MEQRLTLRAVIDDDCRLLWEWANDPEVRQSSFHSHPISWEEHVAWFRHKRGDPACWMYLVLNYQDRPVGQVRFERLADGTAEISLSLTRDHRGQGLGTVAVQAACQRLWQTAGIARIIARVKPENLASIRAFEKAEFVPDGQIWVWSAPQVRMAPMGGRRAVFCVDVGPASGLGHLQRSLALAAAMKGVGISSVFLIEEDPMIRSWVEAAGDAVECWSGSRQVREEIRDTLELSARRSCELAVVDSYRISARDLGVLRAEGLSVVAIDDLAQEPFPCHVVINGGAQAVALPYRSSTGETTFLLGPEYALLRPEFWDVPPRTMSRTVRRILLTIGGGDPHGLLPNLLALLDDLEEDVEVTVVVGPYGPGRSQVTQESWRHPVRLIEAPASMQALMLEADLAITGAGQTMYELAATGTPAIAIQVAENQAGGLRAMAAAGAVWRGGQVGEPGMFSGVRQAIEDVMAHREARVALSAAGKRLVDGRGALRAAQIVAQLSERRQRRGRVLATRP